MDDYKASLEWLESVHGAPVSFEITSVTTSALSRLCSLSRSLSSLAVAQAEALTHVEGEIIEEARLLGAVLDACGAWERSLSARGGEALDALSLAAMYLGASSTSREELLSLLSAAVARHETRTGIGAEREAKARALEKETSSLIVWLRELETIRQEFGKVRETRREKEKEWARETVYFEGKLRGYQSQEVRKKTFTHSLLSTMLSDNHPPRFHRTFINRRFPQYIDPPPPLPPQLYSFDLCRPPCVTLWPIPVWSLTRRTVTLSPNLTRSKS